MSSAHEIDNIFITSGFQDWTQKLASRKHRIANRILDKLGVSVRFAPPISTGNMTSVEQRINMFHASLEPGRDDLEKAVVEPLSRTSSIVASRRGSRLQC